MDNNVLGKRIKEVRRAKKLTQEKLAEKAHITAYFLGEIERGIKMPSIKVFVAIAEALDVSSDYLLRGYLTSANIYIDDEISKKLDKLTPKQRLCAVEILDAYIKTIS